MKMRFATVAVLMLLAGCGFHLQGRQPVPEAFNYTYLDTQDEQTDFVQDLRKALLASGVKVIRTQASSSATVTVHDDELTERILPVVLAGIDALDLSARQCAKVRKVQAIVFPAVDEFLVIDE